MIKIIDRKLLKKFNNTTTAITGVAASILTDLLYDVLTEGNFNVQLSNNAIKIIKINKFTNIERFITFFVLFLFLWLTLSFIIPIIYYIITTFRVYKTPKYSVEEVYQIYNKCKNDILRLQNINQNLKEDCDYKNPIIFCEICCLLLKLHSVFCSSTKYNDKIVKKSFRNGVTINDMYYRITVYEFLATVNIAKNILETAQKNSIIEEKKLLLKDYNDILKCISELQDLPKRLELMR